MKSNGGQGSEYRIGEATVLVLLGDKASNFVYANPAYLQASGYAWDELKGAATAKMVHPDTPMAVFADMTTTIRAKQPWSGIVKNRRKDGRYYWVRLNIMPLFDAQGEFTGSLMAHTPPSRDEIAAIEPLYAAIREGRDRKLTVRFGQVIRASFLHKTAERFRAFGLAGRIWSAVVGIDLAALLFGRAVAAQPDSFFFWGLAAVLVAFSAAIGLYLSHTIVAPLRAAARLANRIAACDLTTELPSARSDEIGRMLRALTQVAVNMRATVSDVRDGTDVLSRATKEIASGSLGLSRQTETQAGNIQKTAAAMEQITSLSENNADTAKQARDLASSASATAEAGGSAVNEVITTMDGIIESSRRIAEIISVIDGIAFQTNILALNAAVEAARAGEQGRGFAVVAAEVRSLAQRSAQAAQEVRTLIQNSVEKIDMGSTLVNSAGKTMEDIVAQIKHVTALVGNITDASLEQSAGVGQINRSLSQLDDMTQQNAALAEQSAASAETMALQAKGLVDAVSVFRLG